MTPEVHQIRGAMRFRSAATSDTVQRALFIQRRPPELLVSVRNVAEAESALAGGCDILDLKEPARGSLGMPDAATVAAVVARVEDSGLRVPISLALGESSEWNSVRSIPSPPTRISYLKLGTAALGNGPGWIARLDNVRRRFDSSACPTAGRGETASDRQSLARNWIAVAYADWEAANGPAPEQVIEMASQEGWAGVLIDTFVKGKPGLFDWLTVRRLASLARRVRSQRLMLALAGKLQLEDVSRLLSIRPDIVGIRSAACRAGVRTDEIEVEAVRNFRLALRVDESSRLQDAAPATS
jgi:uncharacterized protein (UPF0264 family)